MRGTLVFLALVLAGIGGGEAAAASAPSPEGHQLSHCPGSQPASFVRAASRLLPVASQDGSGPTPRAFSRRPHLEGDNVRMRRALPVAAAFDVQDLVHRAFAAPFALTRAGRFSSSNTTAPPFASV